MTFSHLCGDILCIFLGLLGGTILVWIWWEKIDLSDLINEANGRASMSRFQLLVFTFVIAISLFEVVDRKDTLPEIPNGILTLLGISASTYAVGKGISYSQPDVLANSMKDRPDGGDSAAAAQASANAAAQHAAEAKSQADAAKGHADAAQQAAQPANPKAGNPQEDTGTKRG